MSDEIIDVEATPIDDELSVMTKAQMWLADASERVSERCELYKPPERIESEKQRREAMDSRAACRKDVAEIDGERKAMLRKAEDALKEFKAEVKDVLTPLTEIDATYKRLLDEYESGWKANREIELAQEYEDQAPDLVELVPFSRILARYGNERGNVWLNRSTNIEHAKDLLANAVYDIAENEKAIDALVDEEERVEAKARYFETLDFQGTLTEARRAKEQRERVRVLEMARAEMERIVVPEPPVEQPEPEPVEVAQEQPTSDRPHGWVICVPSATREQMTGVAEHMRSQGIVFDAIYSGTLEDALRKKVSNGR